MEKALGDGLGQEAIDQNAGQRGAVNVQSGHGGAVRNFHAVDPVDHQDAAGRSLPVDAGHHEIGFARQYLGQFGRVGGLAAQVEFGFDPALEGGDDGARAQPGKFAAQRFDVARAPFIGGERGGNISLDARAQQLDGDSAALAGHGLVHLGNGSGGHGDGFDRLKTGFPVTISRVQRRFDLAEHYRRQLILQPGEIGGDLNANQIGAGGERLAQFDGSRANSGKTSGKIGRFGRAAAETRDFCHQPYSRRQPPVLEWTQRAVPGHAPAPDKHSPQVDQRHQVRPSIPNGWPPRRPGSACSSPGRSRPRRSWRQSPASWGSALSIQ